MELSYLELQNTLARPTRDLRSVDAEDVAALGNYVRSAPVEHPDVIPRFTTDGTGRYIHMWIGSVETTGKFAIVVLDKAAKKVVGHFNGDERLRERPPDRLDR